MSILFGDSIDLTLNEIQNASLQKLAADPGSPVNGQFWYLTTDSRMRIRTASGTEVVPFLGSSIPGANTVGGAGSAGSSLYGPRMDHSHPMPGLATTSTDGFLSSTFWNRLNDATSLSTANKLAMRDANGRIQVADPSAGQDAANYQWVTQLVENSRAGLAFKDPVRTIFTTALTGTYVAGTKRITASANGAFPANDGISTWAIGDRVALDAQATGTNNGLYRIIDVGSGTTPWILERTEDFGGPGSLATDILSGAYFGVKEGTQYGGTQFVCMNPTVTIDTTAINFQIETQANVDGSTIEVNTSGNLQVKAAGILYSHIQNLSACSILARASNSAGVSASLSAGSDNQVLARVASALVFTSISNAMMASMAAKSVKANATNASAVPTDLAATAADQVFQANSSNTGLEWGTLRTAGITNSAVTYAKIQNVSAQYRVLGRISSGAGVVEELTPANLQALLATAQTSGVKLAAKQFTIGDGTSTSIQLNHGETTQNIIAVHCRRLSDQARFEVGWVASTTALVTLSFGSAPAANGIVATVLYVPN